MNCLKCGRAISEDEVFCVDCQLDAQRYPVDPNTAVYIPRRKAPEAPKKAVRRKAVTPEDQIRILRRRLHSVTVLLILLLALMLVMIYPIFSQMTAKHYQKGQNYSPMVTVPSSATVPFETTNPVE